jgi:hypothetical protein
MSSTLLIDGQGATPNRVVVYVDDATMDVTPISMDTINTPTRIRQIDLTMIYEAETKPYWSEYQFQFKCPNPSYQKKLGGRAKAGRPWVLPDQDMVEFRLAGGSSSPKQRVEISKLAPTDWQTSSSYTMKRAWRVACDSNTIMAAKAASAGADRVIDRNLFRQKMATIGLNDAELTPDGMSPHFLAEFTWTNLWNDVRKPAINSSRKLTPAEQQAFNAQVAAFQKSINDAQALVGGRLKEMQTRTDFTAAAAKYRANRRLSRSESILLQVWLGKTEQDVVAANGNPSVRQAGARFLSYGRAFNNQVLWQNVVTGATMTGGGYDTCNVTFALIPDSAGTLRVADVSVFHDKDGDTRSLRNACSDIMNVPAS